jgi:NAD(P)-dependent dehydrogenase (short-subunit alcohol dehydrogenase family)
MSRIDGKIALVTGAARGLGAATARRFAEAGAKVVITDLNETGGEETATGIR